MNIDKLQDIGRLVLEARIKANADRHWRDLSVSISADSINGVAIRVMWRSTLYTISPISIPEENRDPRSTGLSYPPSLLEGLDLHVLDFAEALAPCLLGMMRLEDERTHFWFRSLHKEGAT